jgi:L-alanine-DL-glutamate epimerase-like enolase superfamily enzyme
MARELSVTRLLPNAEGCICLPERPGLGVEPAFEVLKKYSVAIEIKVGGKMIFQSPSLSERS